MPDNSVDLIITDPPYKITARGNGGNSGGMFQKKEVNNGKVFKNNDIDIVDWLPEFYRILKPNSHCYIMTNNKNITHYLDVIDKSDFHFIKNLIWVKDNKIMGQTTQQPSSRLCQRQEKVYQTAYKILGIANNRRYVGGFPCYTFINGKSVYNRVLIQRI